MAVTTWTAGQVLAAADLNDTFASKVDYALPVNAQTGTTYTFVAADAEKLTTASNAAAVTLTIPPASSVAWPDNTVLRVVNYGAGAVTIDGGSGVTVTNTATTIAQYGAAVAIRTGSDAWTVVPFGGGDVPAAEVSSPAATGQYTDSGITYDYYTFTSSGTLTVDTAGFADILVIGGAGGGGGAYGGGGGAGGYLAVTDAYLPAGTLTVTIGAGGAGGLYGSPTGMHGFPGTGSRVGPYYAIPGGGGGARSDNATFRQYVAPAYPGGSGGGGGGDSVYSAAAVGIQGSDGGAGRGSSVAAGGGGGGAGGVGQAATSGTGGNGGSGVTTNFDNTSTARGGGGGGGSSTGGSASAGGGAGASGNASSGTANTGGGGGGGGSVGTGGSGGSGIVIVRVKV